MAHTENTNICVTDMPLRMKVINLGLLGHLIAFLMALEQRDLTSVWASRTLPCIGPQLESSGQLSPVMQRSLVHLTSTETVVMGISASRSVLGREERRGLRTVCGHLGRGLLLEWKQSIRQCLEVFGFTSVIVFFIILIFSAIFF